MRCAEVGRVDVLEQRCGEEWCGLSQKPVRGVRLLAPAQQMLDLRPQVRVGASLLEERDALVLGPLEGIGREPLHLLPAFDTSHAGAPDRASPSR